jgi:nitrogen regulatory protein PII
MQMIEAVIKPQKLDAVECKGFGRQMGHTERYRGAKMDVGFIPKVLLKICVPSEETDKAIKAIVEAARTGEVGDGKIFVYPVARVVRIRTGETNEQAL